VVRRWGVCLAVSSAFLAGGRTLNWAVAATDNNYWTVRSFTVTWTSYVLR